PGSLTWRLRPGPRWWRCSVRRIRQSGLRADRGSGCFTPLPWIGFRSPRCGPPSQSKKRTQFRLKLLVYNLNGTRLTVAGVLHQLQERPGRMAERTFGRVDEPDLPLYVQFLHPDIAERPLLQLLLDTHARQERHSLIALHHLTDGLDG